MGEGRREAKAGSRLASLRSARDKAYSRENLARLEPLLLAVVLHAARVLLPRDEARELADVGQGEEGAAAGELRLGL